MLNEIENWFQHCLNAYAKIKGQSLEKLAEAHIGYSNIDEMIFRNGCGREQKIRIIQIAFEKINFCLIYYIYIFNNSSLLVV